MLMALESSAGPSLSMSHLFAERQLFQLDISSRNATSGGSTCSTKRPRQVFGPVLLFSSASGLNVTEPNVEAKEEEGGEEGPEAAKARREALNDWEAEEGSTEEEGTGVKQSDAFFISNSTGEEDEDDDDEHT